MAIGNSSWKACNCTLRQESAEEWFSTRKRSTDALQ